MALDLSKLVIGDRLTNPWLAMAEKINAIIDAAGGGGGETVHYPRLDIDAQNYVIVDYGEAANDGN